MRQDRALDAAGALFDRADRDGSGTLDLDELRDLLTTASEEYAQFKEHARFLESRSGMARWGGMVGRTLEKARARAAGVIESAETPLATLDDDTALTRDEFAELLASIDRGLRALPATAQVAKQQVREGEREGRLRNLDGRARFFRSSNTPSPFLPFLSLLLRASTWPSSSRPAPSRGRSRWRRWRPRPGAR